jgi:diguanylate cyclase (GGDEF)-like protein
MVSPLHNSGQAELRDDKVIAPFGELAIKPDIRPDLLFRLSSKLQTTLDLSQILEIFFKDIQAAVLVDGLGYRFRERDLQVSIGRSSPHNVSYDLTTRGERLGELVFYRSTRFREYELANVEGLLSTLVYPLRNALRYREALDASFRDPLTGAGNRVALDRTLDREVELAHRHEMALSVLMLDLDHFKLINDRFGHSTGDQVLKETVTAISDCIRQTDICFRFGGEEFLILLSNANQDDALVVAERIRQAVGLVAIQNPDQVIHPTASIGCASLAFNDSRQSLVHRADLALYTAKGLGRNRVVGEDILINCPAETEELKETE